MNCPKCNTEHDPTKCSGHVVKDPETREPIPPRQCLKDPVKGSTVCRSHGAAKGTPAAAAAADRVQTEAAERVLGRLVFNVDAEPIKNPSEALQRFAGQLQQTVEVVGSRLNSTLVCPVCHRGPEPLDGPTARLWIAAVGQQRQLLTDMDRNGIYGKQVEVEAERVRSIAGALVRVFEVLGLDPDQREVGMRTLFAELRAGETVPGEVTA